METRSWKDGHMTLQEKYDQHMASKMHCLCTESNLDPFLQKHPARPEMTTFETWEGVIYALPTLCFFIYVGFVYGNNETKFYLHTRKLRKRRAEGQSTSQDDEEENMRIRERSQNNWILSEILTYIPTPIFIAIKLSLGVGQQFNWYMVLSPFILTCWYHAFNALRDGNYFITEQSQINIEITKNNMALQLENMVRDGVTEEELQEMRKTHEHLLANIYVSQEDEHAPQSEQPTVDASSSSSSSAAPPHLQKNEADQNAAVLPVGDVEEEKVTLSQKEIASKLPFGRK
jgi:hypothetical protein